MKSIHLSIVDRAQAISALQDGEVLIHPTETCYGLAVDATQSTALDKLFALKKRDADKPVSLLLSSQQQFEELAEVSSVTQKLIQAFLPGPLTLVLPLKESAKKFLDSKSYSPDGWVGLRLTSSSVTQKLAQSYGKPLTTTSANLSGEPEIYDFATLEKTFGKTGLAVLGKENLPKNPPSTVIKVVGKDIELLREGAISLEKIKSSLA